MKYIHRLIIALAFVLGVGCFFTTGSLELALIIIALPTVYTFLHLLRPGVGNNIPFTIVIIVSSLIAGFVFYSPTKSVRIYTTASILIALIPIVYAVLYLFISWRKYKTLLLSLDLFLVFIVIYGATRYGYGDITELVFYFVLPVLLINTIEGCCELFWMQKNAKNNQNKALKKSKKLKKTKKN